MADTVVELSHVTYGYGEHLVLEDVSLQVERGDFLGLVGPNGGGKTTLLRVILGVIRPQSGRVMLFGAPVHTLRERSRIGYLAQRATHYDQRFPATVREVVGMGRYGRVGLGRRLTRVDWQKVDKAIDLVDLGEQRNRVVGRLSGGQQQRVFIARALASQPDLLVLDEPTVGVDARVTAEFYSLLARLHTQLGLTIIMVSHDIGAIVTQVTRLACINRTLVQHACPEHLLESGRLSELYGTPVSLVTHDH